MSRLRATAPTPARVATTTTTILATLALAAGLVACGVPTGGSVQVEDPEDVPFGLLEEAPTTTPPATAAVPAGTALQVCLLRDESLVRVPRAAGLDATLSDVVDVLAAGPTPEERDEGITTALGDQPLIAGVDAAQGVAAVDLTEAFAADVGARQVLAVAQVVCTLTGRPGIGQVTFTLDGEPVAVPRGDGSTTAAPVSIDDYRLLE